MKILVLADVHIGSRPDIADYYEKELSTIPDILIKNKVKIIVIAGDLFDRRISTNSEFNTYANLFINSIAKYCRENNAYLYIVKGTMSHDLYQLDSFLYLTKDPSNNTFIIKTCQEVFVENCKFLFIPEEYEANKEEYYKDTIFNKEKKYDMVFGHGMFTFAGGYAVESCKNNHIVFRPEDFKDNVYGYVVFGHIHISMGRDNCIYTGSFSRDSFGEEPNKGCLLFDYNPETKKCTKEFIINKNAPIFKTINARNIPDNAVGVTIANELKKCYRLRVIIDSDITEEKYNNLKAITYENDKLYLYKRMRGLSKQEEDKKDEEIQKHREKRRAIIERYSKMDFIEVTKNYAKDKYGIELTSDDIKESIA